MNILFAGLAALAVAQTPATGPEWTWTLYADEAPLVLANEIPDTPNLRFTVECQPGSGVARVTLYGGRTEAGMARVTAGDASAVAQSERHRSGGLRLALRADHPVFAAFAAEGRITVSVSGQSRAVEVPRAHLAKLRRFTELCAG